MNSVVIVAGGRGDRYGADKMFALIKGQPLIYRTVQAFNECDFINEIIVVASSENRIQMEELFRYDAKVFITVGGESRVQSVNAGLRLVNRKCDFVAIHDGARPYVTKDLIKRVFVSAEEKGSAVPIVKSSQTVYEMVDDRPRLIDREKLMCVQTPQCFDYQKLCIAYYNAMKKDYTDDSQVFLNEYKVLNFVEGEFTNTKITYPSDLTNVMIGNGVDSHRLQEGRDLILGGVKIPYELGLYGHSDADVLVHAIMDAILMAIGERDIGVLFPDSDMQYKDISSLALLRRVMKMVYGKKLKVTSLSAVIVCQQPKLSSFIPQMIENLSSVINLSSDRINISATTTEGMGLIGNNEGIGCQAVCLVE